MKKLVLVALLVGVAPVSTRAERPMLRGGEAPRATDLLRADKLAEQAEKRLRLPVRRSVKWKKGGGGWDAPGERAAEGQEHVIINVRPPRRSPTR